MRTKQPSSQVIMPHISDWAQAGQDHFASLESALLGIGITADRIIPALPVPRLNRSTRLVIVPNTEASLCRYLLREARRVGAASVLLMDGIVEWRNTFMNTRGGPRFLRPAPVGAVACAGPIDAHVLRAMGNDATPTGLPRLARFAASLHPRAPRAPQSPATLLVATAKTPFFTDAEHGRLLSALQEIRLAAAALGVRVLWRIGAPLQQSLGVACDDRPLAVLLQASDAVLTTPSTLMIEAMLAGAPTGLIHPHPTPLWQPCPWLYAGPDDGALRRDIARLDWSTATGLSPSTCDPLRAIADDASAITTRFSSAHEFIERLLGAGPSDMQRQRDALAGLHPPGPDALAHLGELIRQHICHPAPSSRPAAGADPADRAERSVSAAAHAPPVPARPNTPPHQARVVFLVKCDDGPAGHSLQLARRIARQFSDRPTPYDVHVLAIASAIDGWRAAGTSLPHDDLTHPCVLDPCEDNVATLQRIGRAIDALHPAILIPADRDFCFASAIRARDAARADGRRIDVVAFAADGNEHDRSLARHYHTWDGAIAANQDGAAWLAPLASCQDVPCARLSVGGELPEPDLSLTLSEFLGAVRSAHPRHPSTALACSLVELCHALRPPPADLTAAREWIRHSLLLAGVPPIWIPPPHHAPPPEPPLTTPHAVVIDEPADADDIDLAIRLLERSARGDPTTRPLDRIVWFPSLMTGQNSLSDRRSHAHAHELIRRTLRQITAAGSTRLVIYGMGKHMYAHSAIFDEGFPIVGITDDDPPPHERMFGLPVVPLSRVDSLRPDVLVLFSDAWESAMWHKTVHLRRRGVHVAPIYSTFIDEPPDAPGPPARTSHPRLDGAALPHVANQVISMEAPS